MSNWRSKLIEQLKENNETFDDIIHQVSNNENWLDEEFNDDYGLPHGSLFTVWTMNRVYFPCVYDGYEYVDSVPRNPVDKPIYHIGRY